MDDLNTWIQFTLLGLGPGGIYALSGLSIVIAYRASGTLNFAAGAMGALAAYVFYDLRDEHGVPWQLALVIALVLGALIGAAMQVLLLSRLRDASPLTKLIGTLGVLTVIQGFIEAYWDSDQRLVAPILEVVPIQITDDLSVSRDRLILVALTIVLAAILGIVYRRTLFGLATTAVSEDRRAAASLGWSTRRIELVNWMIAGSLAALAGVLLAPIVGLKASTLSLIVIPALAAALIGKFSSGPLTVVGGLVIGVAESELSRYNDEVPGISRAVPFLIIVLVLVAGGRARPSRADLVTRLPRPGAGRVVLPIALAAAVLAFGFTAVASDTGVSAMITASVGALVLLSIVVVTGFGGQLSLGQWALAGFGAWVTSRLADATSLGFWIAALIGIVATIPVAVIVGLPALRSRGVNLAIATLGMALLIEAMILGNSDFTGGLDGTPAEPPRLFGMELDAVLHPTRYAVMALVVVVISAIVVANVRRSRTGLRLLAVRSNERAAAALGINVYGVKLYAFALSAVFAALAGIITAFRTGFVVFSQFNVFGSIQFVTYSVIGGVGWVIGALIAGLSVPGSLLPEAFDAWIPLDDWIVPLLGLLVLIILVVAPDGIAARQAAMWRQLAARFGRAAPPAPKPSRVLPPRTSEPLDIAVDGLTVRYGGVIALDDVSFTVPRGAILGLIGPNGAGKTTLLDVVTGFTKPSSGAVTVGGASINDWSPTKRARAGIGRSFQSVELFEEMSVRENLLAAVERHENSRFLIDPIKPGRLPVSELMLRVIDEFELEPHLDLRPSELPQGRRRVVGIARSVLNEPSVLFLDEPAAGLDETESAEFGRLLRHVVEEYGITVVLVEHDVPLVLRVCDHVVVLDFGRKIAEGSPAEIGRDQRVIDAYLGTDHDLDDDVDDAADGHTASAGGRSVQTTTGATP